VGAEGATASATLSGKMGGEMIFLNKKIWFSALKFFLSY
jgi:hypothetical protein